MFDTYSLIKTIHILAGSLMIGATFVNGILHGLAYKANTTGAAALLSGIGKVNRLIMGPSFVVIPASGLYLIYGAGFDWMETWLLTTIILTGALILAFFVGGRLEHQLLRAAEKATEQGQSDLPAIYESLMRKAIPIGAAATLMSLTAIYLMTAKPF